MMRTLLVLMLLMGLVPDAVEIVEASAHLVATGHVPLWEPGENDLGDEHGCGPLDHHCGCCVAQAALTSWAHPSVVRILSPSRPLLLAADTGVDMASLPFRPPISA